MECPYLNEIRQGGVVATQIQSLEDQDDNFIPKRVTESVYENNLKEQEQTEK
jgi:hypothetical protein